MQNYIHSLPRSPTPPFISAVGHIPGSCHLIRGRYNSLGVIPWVWFLLQWRPWAKETMYLVMQEWDNSNEHSCTKKDGLTCSHHWSNSEIQLKHMSPVCSFKWAQSSFLEWFTMVLGSELTHPSFYTRNGSCVQLSSFLSLILINIWGSKDFFFTYM